MRDWRLAMRYIATGLSRKTAITMSRSDDCIICKLISGEIEASMVYQDNLCSAFLDHELVNTDHTLVAPNRHVSNLATLRDDENAQLFRVAASIAASQGANIWLKNGEAAGQDVFHGHLRVHPRDGVRLIFDPRYKPMTKS
jgi:histidine triad (HIT) family protein